MPRQLDGDLLLQPYEEEIGNELLQLDYEILKLDLEIDLLDEIDYDSDTSLSSVSSLSSLSSTSDWSTSSSTSNSSSDESELDEMMDIVGEILSLVPIHRYINERVFKLKSRDFVTRILPELDDNDFKEQYRMFPASFCFILRRIENHPVFQPDAERRPQEPPHFQLLVVLKRFTTEPNSASDLSAFSELFGIGADAVALFTDRVTTALMSLWREVVSWKSNREKKEMRRRIREKGYNVLSSL